MKLETIPLEQGIAQRVVHVTLSESNVRTLLHKLVMEGSGRLIYKRISDDEVLVLTVEKDDEHYNGEQRGIMHPETEAVLRAAQSA